MIAGYEIAPAILTPHETSAVERALDAVSFSGAGTRNLLEQDWCRDLVERLRVNPGVRAALSQSAVAV